MIFLCFYLRCVVNHSAPASSVVALPTGAIVASFTDGRVRVLDGATGRLAQELAGHSRAITAMDVHPTRPAVCVLCAVFV